MLAFINAKILPIDQKPIPFGTMLICQGQIAAIGDHIAVPSDARVIDLQGKYVLPGWVDAHTHVGNWGEAEGSSAYDGNEGTAALTPQVRGIDAINPAHHSFADARAIGTTTVQTGPGSGNPIGGEQLVTKTAGKIIDHMVLRAPSGLKSALGENPKRFHGSVMHRMPNSRMGSAALIRDCFYRAREYMKKRAAGVVDLDLGMESYCKVLRQEIPLRVHAHRADDIVTACRIAKEFDIKISLEHCTEGHLVAEFLAEQGFPACVGPTLSHRSKLETINTTFSTPKILIEAGVKVALITDHPFVPIPYYNVVGALAVRAGLTEDAALRAMTLSPAEIIGVSDRVGSLTAGKDADFVVWSGHPFKAKSQVLETYIDGMQVYKKSV